MVNGHIEIGNGLRLHALSSVHNQESTLASRDATRYLIAEVDVSRSVDEIEYIVFTVMLVLHLYSMALDGDAALSFQIHVVKHLVFGDLNRIGVFQHTISKR